MVDFGLVHFKLKHRESLNKTAAKSGTQETT